MSIEQAYRDGIAPALAWLPPKMDTLTARVMVGAIGFQESEFEHRRQMGNGPARSYWQMERTGGVTGVLRHPASAELARAACAWRGIGTDSTTVWKAMEFDDVLGAVFARLLLYTDPHPLPGVADVDYAWDYYYRNWRPGKPHIDKWPNNHQRSINFFKGVL